MAKKKSAAKPTKAASKKTAAKASSKKTMKAAPKSAAKTASKSAKAAPKTAKAAAPKKAAAKKAAPKKAVGKATAKAKSKPVGKTAKAAPKSAAKPTAKIISMDQARKSQKGADFSSLFTPLDDRIVIQRAGVADRTPGGLYIPETVADRPNQGRVVAVGPGRRNKKGRIQPLDVQLGDTVMYAQYAGSEISVNGIDVIVLREEEVLAIMK